MERPSELISEKKSSKEYTEDLIREYLKGTMKRKGALKGAPGGKIRMPMRHPRPPLQAGRKK